MNLENNTVLITGGSSGLGFELAKQLIRKNNMVIICGRTHEKLISAKKKLPEILYFQCDIAKEESRLQLRDWVKLNHPECNIIVNNAAIVHRTNFWDDEESLVKSELEINTNLIGPIALCKLFKPLLETNKNSAIINITTGLIYAPKIAYPFYNATKSALHTFTKIFREQIKASEIRVVEVQMPAVDTPWHNGNPPKIAITPERAIKEMILQLEKGELEIKIGGVKILYWLSRLSPSYAFKKINEIE